MSSNDANLFAYPSSLTDPKWKWRQLLQSRLSKSKSQQLILSKRTPRPIDSKVEPVDEKQLNSKAKISAIDRLEDNLAKNCLKLACPKHDLVNVLLQAYRPDGSSAHISNRSNESNRANEASQECISYAGICKHSLCNGYSVDCPKICHNELITVKKLVIARIKIIWKWNIEKCIRIFTHQIRNSK